MIRSFKYRAYPTAKQDVLLTSWLGVCCDLYNAAVQERKTGYQWWKRGWRDKVITYEGQTVALTEVREANVDVRAVPVWVARSALRRADNTERYVIAMRSAGKSCRFRYKSKRGYDTFDYPANAKRLLHHEPGARMARIRLPGAGGWLKIRYHREIVGTPKQVIVTRKGDQWQVVIICDDGVALPPTVDHSRVDADRMVGLDVGIRYLAALSTGEIIDNPRYSRAAAKILARRQRELARKRKGSKARRRAKERLRRAFRHVAEQRKQHCRRMAKDLTRRFDLIAMEDLNIARMVHGHLAYQIYDAAWSMLGAAIAYKAASAGKLLVKVNPSGTSQRCSGCNAVVPKSLSVRLHYCDDCGTSLDRDVNAAKNILALALEAPCVGAVAEPGVVEPDKVRRSTLRRGQKKTEVPS
jgi:putative transposase